MMIWRSIILCWLGAMAIIGGAQAQNAAPAQSVPMTPEAFMQAALAEAQALPGAPGRVAISGPLSFTIDAGSAEQRVANLDRIYEFCQRVNAAGCVEARHRFLRAMLEPTAPFTAENLRVTVRSGQWVALLRQMLGPDADKQPYVRPLGGDLFALLVFDSPQQMAYPGRHAFGHLVMDEDALWVRGLANTFAGLPPIATTADALGQAAQGRKRLYEFEEYGLTWLAAPERWAALSAAVGPNLVVAPVSDNLLLVADAGTGDAAELRATARYLCGQVERCVSDNIYHLRDGLWVVAQ